MLNWILNHPGLAASLGLASLAIIIAGLVLIPALIVRIPPDFFSEEKKAPPAWANRRPYVWMLVVGAKNLFGVALILASIAGFLLPGLGVVTISIGLLLVDFPGKYRFIRWLISRPFIFQRINRLRQRRGREPIQVH